MFRCIFEPREEVERLAKLPTVVQAPGDGRQIFQTDSDMARLFLEDGTALILSQSPPRFRLANGNKRGSRRLGWVNLCRSHARLIAAMSACPGGARSRVAALRA